MFKRIIGYISLIVTISLISIYFKSYELMYLVFFLVNLPIIDIILVKNSAGKIECSFNIENLMINKGETIPIDIHVNNKGLLPVIMFECKFSCTNGLHNSQRDFEIIMPILKYGVQDYRFAIKSAYCGDVEIKLKEINCVDYFGFYYCRIHKTYVSKVYVIPKVHDIDNIEIDKQSTADIEGMEFSKFKSGDDPTEVFDIREYRPGDKLHSVHWKLTARKGMTMVKEFSLPLNSNYSVVMDLGNENIDKKHKEIDSITEVALKIMLKMQEEGLDCQLIAYERNEKYIFRDIIAKDETLSELMYEIYKSKATNNADLLRKYALQSGENDESNIYYISSYISEDNIMQLANSFKKANKTYIYVSEKCENNSFQKMADAYDVNIVAVNNT